jgi:threonine dehydrogenase-like Zn-dependent dehydrogenase
MGLPIGVGGFDRSYVCVGGRRGVEDALRFTRSGGTVVLLGNVATLGGVDWTPLWLKELTFFGTLAYGAHAHGGASVNAFEEASQLIASGRAPIGGLVTHQFALGAFRSALATARTRGNTESVKVAFTF